MDIYVNGELTQEVGYNHNEPVKYYWCKAPELLDITVRIESSEYHITAERVDDSRGVMAVATLFKNDSHKIETFCDWYRKQGVQKFFLYYNGASLPNDIYKADDIEYRCWNFSYWNDCECDWRHNAQVTFLTAMVLRNLPRYDWFGLMDLDELIYHPRYKLIDYFSSVPNECQTIMVRNHWAKKIDVGFEYTQEPMGWSARTKCFYRGTYSDLVGVHNPKKNIHTLYPPGLIMVHYTDEKDGIDKYRYRTTFIVGPTQILAWS